MTTNHLDSTVPTIDAPRAESSVRTQSAIVRSLAHALECLMAEGDPAEGVREQLREELERLRRPESLRR